MSYLNNDTTTEDKFGIHSNISKTLYQIIHESELDLSKGSFTVGLFGKWGSGKSLILDRLHNHHISDKSGIVYIYIDVWKYVNTSMYRSVLFDIESQLKKSKNWDVSQKFKNGYQYEGESLKSILDRDVQVEEPAEKSENDKKNTGEKIKEFFWKYRWFLSILLVLFLLKIFSDIWKWTGVREVLGYLTQIFLVVGGFKVFDQVFKDIGKEFVSKTSLRVVSSPPTFSQDQFENIFKDMIQQTLDCINEKVLDKKVVIVFDNLDRCEPELSYQTLTGLRTFMDSKNCVYIIPCDDKEILNHLYQNTKGIPVDFMDKIFQTYIRIPELELFDRDDFIDDLMKDCSVPIDEEQMGMVKSIIYRGYKGRTPRQIKRFINDYETYYKLSKNIDPNGESIIKDLNVFTFFMVLKQVYPEVEPLLVKYPEFFVKEKKEEEGDPSKKSPKQELFKELQEYYLGTLNSGDSNEKNNRSVKMTKPFRAFVELYEDKLNLSKCEYVLNYIFMKKEVRYDYLSLKQNLINVDEENIKITKESPVLFEQILDDFIDKKETVFLQDSVDLMVSKIIEKPEDPLMDELLKVLWTYRYEVPVGSILGDSSLFNTKLDKILEINNDLEVPDDFETSLSYLITSVHTELNQTMFDKLIVQMKEDDIDSSFFIVDDEINLPDEIELVPEPYILNSSIEDIGKYLPFGYLDHLFSEFSFSNDDVEEREILHKFIDDDGYFWDYIGELLSEKMSDIIGNISTYRDRHECDDYIIEYTKKLNKDESEIDSGFLNNLYTRMNYLVGNNIQDPGFNYFDLCVKLLKDENQLNQVLHLFNNSHIFTDKERIQDYLIETNQMNLEYTFEWNELRESFVNRIESNGVRTQLYNMLNFEFISKYKDVLIVDDSRWSLNTMRVRLSSMLKNKNVENRDSIQELYDELYQKFKDLNYDDNISYLTWIVSRLDNRSDKIQYVFDVVDTFISDVHNYKDVLTEMIEYLIKIREVSSSGEKRKITTKSKKWKKSVEDEKNLVKLKNRIDTVSGQKRSK